MKKLLAHISSWIYPTAWALKVIGMDVERTNMENRAERLARSMYQPHELGSAEAWFDVSLRLAEKYLELSDRYELHENQRLCLGYSGGCDGNLEGLPHERKCPARIQDLVLRPHLYKRRTK